MSLRTMDNVTAVTTTANATPVAALTYAIPSGCSFYMEAVCALRNTSTGDSGSLKVAHRGKNVGGTVTMLGSVLTLAVLGSDASLVTAAATLTNSSGNVLLNITGVAATSIEWFCSVSIWIN